MIWFNIKKHFLHYFKQDILLLVCIIVTGYMWLFSSALDNTNKTIEQNIMKNIGYEVKVSGGVCDANAFMLGGSSLESKMQIMDSYYGIRQYLLDNNASFTPLFINKTNGYIILTPKQIELLKDTENYINYKYFYGVDNNYFKENDIEIVDGRAIENSGEIVINESTYFIDEENSITEVNIGDTLSVFINYDTVFDSNGIYELIFDEPMVFEVVGKYKERKANILEVEGDDFQLNRRYYISREDALKYYDEYVRLFRENNIRYKTNTDLPLSRLHNVKFTFENEEEFLEKYSEIKRKIGYYSTEDVVYEFSSNLDWVNGVLQPLKLMEEAFNSFTTIFLILMAVLSSLFILINYNQSKKADAIKMVLGMKYNDVLKEKVIKNILLTIMGFVASLVLFQFSYPYIIEKIFVDGIKMQNELLRISSGAIDGFNSYLDATSNIDITTVTFNEMIMIVFSMILIITVISVILYKLVQPKNIKKAITD